MVFYALKLLLRPLRSFHGRRDVLRWRFSSEPDSLSRGHIKAGDDDAERRLATSTQASSRSLVAARIPKRPRICCGQARKPISSYERGRHKINPCPPSLVWKLSRRPRRVFPLGWRPPDRLPPSSQDTPLPRKGRGQGWGHLPQCNAQKQKPAPSPGPGEGAGGEGKKTYTSTVCAWRPRFGSLGGAVVTSGRALSAPSRSGCCAR